MPEPNTAARATAGMTTGIIGTALGALNGLGILGGGGNAGGLIGVREGGVSEKDIRYVRELNEKDARIIRLESEAYATKCVAEATGPLRDRIAALEANAGHAAGELGNLWKRCECTFVPQEKGYINAKRINYHGAAPALALVTDTDD